MRFADPGEDRLGGKLLYAGELNEVGRILAIAGNISGAATLAVSAQAATLRQAMHAGVIDFLVNSLDEALRILKNEIRKHEPVSVVVSLAPQAIAQQMLDRGVLPDLLPARNSSVPGDSSFETFIAQGAKRIAPSPLPRAQNSSSGKSLPGSPSVPQTSTPCSSNISRPATTLAPDGSANPRATSAHTSAASAR